MVPEDFTVLQEGGLPPAPGIATVSVVGGDRVLIGLDRPIEPIAWTTIRHVPTVSGTRLGYLPGDVDGNGRVDGDDIFALVLATRGAGGAIDEWALDIDRSGQFNHVDLLALIDLMVGADSFDSYLGQSLP